MECGRNENNVNDLTTNDLRRIKDANLLDVTKQIVRDQMDHIKQITIIPFECDMIDDNTNI
jgi:hypothetical protein